MSTFLKDINSKFQELKQKVDLNILPFVKNQFLSFTKKSNFPKKIKKIRKFIKKFVKKREKERRKKDKKEEERKLESIILYFDLDIDKKELKTLLLNIVYNDALEYKSLLYSLSEQFDLSKLRSDKYDIQYISRLLSLLPRLVEEKKLFPVGSLQEQKNRIDDSQVLRNKKSDESKEIQKSFQREISVQQEKQVSDDIVFPEENDFVFQEYEPQIQKYSGDYETKTKMEERVMITKRFSLENYKAFLGTTSILSMFIFVLPMLFGNYLMVYEGMSGGLKIYKIMMTYKIYVILFIVAAAGVINLAVFLLGLYNGKSSKLYDNNFGRISLKFSGSIVMYLIFILIYITLCKAGLRTYEYDTGVIRLGLGQYDLPIMKFIYGVMYLTRGYFHYMSSKTVKKLDYKEVLMVTSGIVLVELFVIVAFFYFDLIKDSGGAETYRLHFSTTPAALVVIMLLSFILVGILDMFEFGDKEEKISEIKQVFTTIISINMMLFGIILIIAPIEKLKFYPDLESFGFNFGFYISTTTQIYVLLALVFFAVVASFAAFLGGSNKSDIIADGSGEIKIKVE